MDAVPGQDNHQLKFSLDYRFIIILLFVVIIAMLAIWQPWAVPNNNTRTVTATGTSTIKASPDEYDFTPSYEFKDADKAAALAALTAKSSSIVAALKALGVPDAQIKTTSNGNSGGGYYTLTPGGQPTYSLALTVSITNKDLVQKVQDYLVTTTPTGGVSPQPTFSPAKQKSLDAQARDEAAKDAKANALQMAKTLGYHLGAVKSVDDSQSPGIVPIDFGVTTNNGAVGSAAKPAPAILNIQPGENSINYTVEVVYFIR